MFPTLKRLWQHRARKYTRSLRHPQRPALALEALEDRLVMSTVVGTEFADTITIERTFQNNLRIRVETPADALGVRVTKRTDTLYHSRGSEVLIEAGDGADTIIIKDLAFIDRAIRVKGGGGNNTVKNETPTGQTWELMWEDGAGRLGSLVSFEEINNLVGGTNGGDRFRIHPIGWIAGWVDGQNAPNAVLDYSFWSAGVRVNLEAGTADALGKGLYGIRNVTGGAGADSLTGDGNANVLHGGDGNDGIWGRGGDDILLGERDNDRLYGDAGTDLVVGGLGADFLEGGAGVDILLDGTTAYDGQDASLRAVLQGWKDRLSLPTQRRNDQMRAGVTANGLTVRLDASTVFSDSSTDTLQGNFFTSDWLGVGPGDSIEYFILYPYPVSPR